MRLLISIPVFLGLLLTAALISPAAADADGAKTLAVLNRETPWRFHVTYRPPVYGTQRDADIPEREKVNKDSVRDGRWVRWGTGLTDPFPDATWTQSDFDDRGWPRGGACFSEPYGFRRWDGDIALLCARTRFGVTDPARVGDLTLEVTYRGGIAVHLNGKEVGRAHMPNGDIAMDTLADDYPLEAFLDNGRPLRDYGKRKPPAALRKQLDKRVRRATFTIPARLLARGTNVLAIEAHRAAYDQQVLKARKGVNWDTVGLIDVELTAPASAAVQPNAAPGPQVRVWAADAALPLTRDLHGDPFADEKTIELHMPRNGFASGQIVCSSPNGVPSIQAFAAPLRGPDGVVVPTDNIRVRYADLTHDYIGLMDEPVAAGERQAVWVTVWMPEDAPAGKYTGTLVLNGLEKKVQVPIVAHVYDWKVNSPKDWVTCVNLMQSPESVAGHYKVPLWSDRHFELLAPSLRMMAEAGNDVLGVLAVPETVFGNDPLIVFRKKNGKYEPDLKHLWRYLWMYNQEAGEPMFLSVHVWNYGMYYSGQTRDGFKNEEQKKTRKPIRAETIQIAVIDDDGRITTETIPHYGGPGTEDIWKPAMDGVRKMVRDMGWKNTRILLGTSGDNWVGPPTVEFFRKIAPWARWRALTHGNGVPTWPNSGDAPRDTLSEADRTQPNGMVVDYCEIARRIYSKRQHDPLYPVTCNARDALGADPFQHRTLPVINVINAQFDGLCWKGIDYWPYETEDGLIRRALNTYVRFGNMVGSGRRTLGMPGPNGAVPTAQYEMLREGIQDCEALIFIRAAMRDPATREKLDPALVRRCEQLLTDIAAQWETGLRYHPHGGCDVRRNVKAIYQTAADLDAALRK